MMPHHTGCPRTAERDASRTFCLSIPVGPSTTPAAPRPAGCVDKSHQGFAAGRLFNYPVDAKLSSPGDYCRRQRTGHQQDPDAHAASTQRFDQFQARHIWHLIVQDQTRGTLRRRFQKLGCGSKCLDRVSHDIEQKTQRVRARRGHRRLRLPRNGQPPSRPCLPLRKVHGRVVHCLTDLHPTSAALPPRVQCWNEPERRRPAC